MSAARHDGPRVSVIIIVFNGARFLRDAILSVQHQTYSDWELLIVDDGSTDSSRDIAEEFCKADQKQIRLLRHPDGLNHGMSATRNLGIGMSQGEFVAFLDADDVWLPAKLAEQIKILDMSPAVEMVYGRTLIWHSWDEHTAQGADYFYDLGVKADCAYEPPLLLELLIANKCQTPTTCNAIMRRSLVERVGGFEESFTGMFEDQIFFTKALFQATTYVSDQVWAKYRQHAASHSTLSARAGRDELARLRYLRWARRYFSVHKAPLRTRSAIRREIVTTVLSYARKRVRRLIRKSLAR